MKIIPTPAWFLNIDTAIELFSFIILFVFFMLCFRNYKINRKKSFLRLGWGFLFITIGQFVMILTKIILFYNIKLVQEVGVYIIQNRILQTVDTVYNIGFFIYYFLALFGLFIIYKIPEKKLSRGELFLTAYLIAITSFFSLILNYVYHISAFVMFLLVVYNYSRIYKKNKLANTKILLIGFSILALSQFIFIEAATSGLYVFAEFVQLIGYMVLLALMARILVFPKTQNKKNNQKKIRL